MDNIKKEFYERFISGNFDVTDDKMTPINIDSIWGWIEETIEAVRYECKRELGEQVVRHEKETIKELARAYRNGVQDGYLEAKGKQVNNQEIVEKVFKK